MKTEQKIIRESKGELKINTKKLISKETLKSMIRTSSRQEISEYIENGYADLNDLIDIIKEYTRKLDNIKDIIGD